MSPDHRQVPQPTHVRKGPHRPASLQPWRDRQWGDAALGTELTVRCECPEADAETCTDGMPPHLAPGAAHRAGHGG